VAEPAAPAAAPVAAQKIRIRLTSFEVNHMKVGPSTAS
jgi:hypothetical protein